MKRRLSRQVAVGEVLIGGGAPIVVQSMTNTDTADVEATALQVEALARAGSELVRITVNSRKPRRRVARSAIASMRAAAACAGRRLPYNGHKLAQAVPRLRSGVAKYRINRATWARGKARRAVRHDDRVRPDLRQARWASA